MSQLNSCVNLHVSENEIREIVQKAKDWALMHGLCLRMPDPEAKDKIPDKVQIISFLLLPSTFPKAEFEKARKMQTVLQEIIHKVAYDYEFIYTCLSSIIESDEFVRRLFNIYETVYKEGNFEKAYNLGILRSDYMLQGDANKIKQIEINTIASSLGGLSTVVCNYHRFILSTLGHSEKLDNLPVNNATVEICLGLVDAWKLYNNAKAVIMFVVEDYTANIADQRFIEFQIQTLNPSIQIIRRSMKILTEQAKLGPNKELIVDKYIVSVVYYRSAYVPSFYPTEKEWDLRLLIEKSNAIKCPSIQYQLAGTKKIQQVLSMPSVLRKFTKNEEEFKLVQDLFVNLYSLEFDDEGNKAVEMALKNPEGFVLKPQREGGGFNVYGKEIKETLGSIKESNKRTAYILMDKINPPSQKNYLIQVGVDDCDKLKNVVSELGIYGVILGNKDNIIVNNQTGFILRTKLQTSNEGGLAAGFGAIDSPYLTS